MSDTTTETSDADTDGLDAATIGENESVARPNDDADPERSERAEAAGRGVGAAVNALRVGTSRTWNGFLYGLTSMLGTDKVWHNRFKKTLKRMYKSTDADAIAFVARQTGEILPTPVKYRPPNADVDADDEDAHQHGYWEAAHLDQTFSAATGEVSTEHIDNIPVIFLDTDDWAEASFSGALLAEAVDMGQKDLLYTNPTFNVIELIQHPGDAADAPGGTGARADGGTVESKVRVENADIGQLDDVAVDVASPGNLDGIRVQWEKFKDLRLDRTTVEEMNQVEQRGYLAGRVDAESDSGVGNLKWWILGMVALGLGAFYLGSGAGGGGGGGGGSGGLMPLVMSLGMLARTAPTEVGWL